MRHKRFTLNGQTYIFLEWINLDETIAIVGTLPKPGEKKMTAEQLKDAVFDTDEEHLAWLKQRSEEVLKSAKPC